MSYRQGSESGIDFSKKVDIIYVMVISPVQYNFKVFDFAKVCKEISRNTLNDISVYGLLNEPKLTRDVKKLLLHHTILCICEFFIKHRSNVPSVLHFKPGSYTTRLHEFYSPDLIEDQIFKNIQKIQKLLPVRIFVCNVSFTTVAEHIQCNRGEGTEFLNSLNLFINSNNSERHTFSKVRDRKSVV